MSLFSRSFRRFKKAQIAIGLNYLVNEKLSQITDWSVGTKIRFRENTTLTGDRGMRDQVFINIDGPGGTTKKLLTYSAYAPDDVVVTEQELIENLEFEAFEYPPDISAEQKDCIQALYVSNPEDMRTALEILLRNPSEYISLANSENASFKMAADWAIKRLREKSK